MTSMTLKVFNKNKFSRKGARRFWNSHRNKQTEFCDVKEHFNLNRVWIFVKIQFLFKKYESPSTILSYTSECLSVFKNDLILYTCNWYWQLNSAEFSFNQLYGCTPCANAITSVANPKCWNPCFEPKEIPGGEKNLNKRVFLMKI